MTGNPATPSINVFRCPACRARQPLQRQCRRCGADLDLLVRIHRRIHYLLDHPTAENQQELSALDPQRRCAAC